MANSKTEFYVSRPTLAGLLMQKGMKAEIRPNPWQRERRMWVFPLTKELAETVLDYYQNIGERVPGVIENYFRQRGNADDR